MEYMNHGELMEYMNHGELYACARRYQSHPVLGTASHFMLRLYDLVNANSDGWPYVSSVHTACKQMYHLLKNPEEATEDSLKKALRPIKAFCTRHKWQLPPLDVRIHTRVEIERAVYAQVQAMEREELAALYNQLYPHLSQVTAENDGFHLQPVTAQPAAAGRR